MRIKSEHCEFEGEAGPIEGILDLPEAATGQMSLPKAISVNCHPHSLHGGSMTNKVTYTVSRAMAGLGIPGLRFNFRGVGQSAGDFDSGIGEQQDLAAAVRYMTTRFPNRQLILSGFSFGAFVSALATTHLSPRLLLSVAPPVDRFDFDRFQRPDCEWQVLMGDEDELVSYQAVVNWLQTFDKPPKMQTFSGAGHFFHGRLVELRSAVESVIRDASLT